ncbi:MAG: dTMP kinase [Marmoricola sp.]
MIVFEGLDKAGKSTQLERMKQVISPSGTTFAHMPSGFGGFSAGVYNLLENNETAPVNPLARQLAHLACHSESMVTLAHQATSGALVLDRWWWSTLAYGWYGRGDSELAIGESTFRRLIEGIWAPIRADVVFLFLHAYAPDSNNSDGVLDGYRKVADQSPFNVVRVPALGERETHDLLVAELKRLGLVVG